MVCKILRIITVAVFTGSVGLSLTAGTTASSPLALSEKCSAPGTAREAMREATAVFIGKITKIDESGDDKMLELSVEQYWKGEKNKTQNVQVNVGMRYSPDFNVGERYIIYAYKNSDGKLAIGRCTRTKLAQYAADDIKVLGKGKRP